MKQSIQELRISSHSKQKVQDFRKYSTVEGGKEKHQQERISLRRYWTKQSIQIAQKQSISSLTSSETHLENFGSRKYVEPLRSEWSPQSFTKRPRCWTMHIVKLKNPTYEQIPAALEGGCILYGRKIRLSNLPWKVSHWPAQYQLLQNTQATCQLVVTNERVHEHRWTLYSFMK